MTYTKRNKWSEAELSNFRNNLKRLQEEQNATNVELAEVIGASANYICQLRSGKCKPSDRMVNAISDIFGTTPNALFTSEAESKKAEWELYGKKLRLAREKKGFTAKETAEFLGIPSSVYKLMEAGECSTTDSDKTKLEKLLGTGGTKSQEAPVVAAPKATPTIATPVAREELSDEVIDLILKHVKDLQFSKDIQKKVFRELTEIRTRRLEERLFG